MTKGRWILAAVIVAVVGFATVQGLRPHPPPPVEVGRCTAASSRAGESKRLSIGDGRSSP